MRASGGEETGRATDDRVIRAHSRFLDARVNPVRRRLRDMIMLLESYCRDRCSCRASNDALVEKFDRELRNAQLILRSLESARPIRRVTARSSRLGMVLLGGRSDPGRPVADTTKGDRRDFEGLSARDQLATRRLRSMEISCRPLSPPGDRRPGA
jgi:hypothetical protein